MKHLFSVVACFWLLALSGEAGNIRGIVKAEGKATTGSTASGQYDSRKYKFVEKVNYEELRDFVVYIAGPVTNTTVGTNLSAVVDTRRVNQERANFSPHVLPVMAGTTVEWPNNDEIFHNVFSMSDAKSFDLGLYKGNPKEKAITFDKVGRAEVFCSIHANMHCVVLVLENPYFTVSGTSGAYSITNVPPGTYKLKAWHERLPVQTQEIVVPAEGEVKVDFVLGIKNLPQY